MQNFRKCYYGKKSEVLGLIADDFRESFFEHGRIIQLKLFGREDDFTREAVLLLGGHAEFSCPLILLQTSILQSCPCSLSHMQQKTKSAPSIVSELYTKLTCICMCVYIGIVYNFFRAEAYSQVNLSQMRYSLLSLFVPGSLQNAVFLFIYIFKM